MLIKRNVSSLLIYTILVVSWDRDSVLGEAGKQLALAKKPSMFTIDIQTAVTPPCAAGTREILHRLNMIYSPNFNFSLSSTLCPVI